MTPTESHLHISQDMLELLKSIGFQVGYYNGYYESGHIGGLIHSALGRYRSKFVKEDRREEFYTICMEALLRGQEEGREVAPSTQGS